MVETTDRQKNVAERCIIYAQGIGMKKQKDEPTNRWFVRHAQAHTSMYPDLYAQGMKEKR